MKVFASYGRFFDRVKFELPRGLFGGDVFLQRPDRLPSMIVLEWEFRQGNRRERREFPVDLG